MNIINIGTYPPKQCGIATFSADLYQSLILNNNHVKIIAVSDDSYIYNYPPEVLLNLKQNQKSEYIRAANLINSTSTDMVIIQHEYGIYGGSSGEFILELIRHLKKPFVIVTHTVLPHPSKKQKMILDTLCQKASAIISMSQKSAKLLSDLYEAPQELVQVIPHGVPDFKKENSTDLKIEYGLQGRDIISTFGLIGPGKGLEIGIKAMADVVKEFPASLYLILGQTHPMLKKAEGEKYRSMLESLVEECHLTNHVHFINKYLTDEELGKYLYMTDIYLSPYPNKDQAVSGTMAFAIGCARAIVSTDYAYARENLAYGRGLLSKEADPQEIASLIKSVLADKSLKKKLQQKAGKLGANWSWRNIGQLYTRLFNKLIAYDLAREETKYSYAEL